MDESMTEQEYIELAEQFLERVTLQDQLTRLGLNDDVFICDLAEPFLENGELCDECIQQPFYHVGPGSTCEGNFCVQAIGLWLEKPTPFTDKQLLDKLKEWEDEQRGRN